MPLDDEFLKQIIETFKAELDERLLAITDGVLELEKIGQGKGDGVEKVIDELFRSAHNIKGSARGIGVNDVGEIAHDLETLFTAIKKKNVLISSEIVNLCLQAVDAMREAMSCFSQKIPLSFDMNEILNQLRNAVGGVASSAESKPQPSSDEKEEQAPQPSTTKQEEALPLAEPIEPVAKEPPQPIEEKPSESPVVEKEKEEKDIAKGALPTAPDVPAEQSPAKARKIPVKTSEFETIRISLSNLDRVSAYMEEMQIQKIAIDEHFIEVVQLANKIKQFNTGWKNSILELKSISDRQVAIQLDQVYDVNVDRLSEINQLVSKMHKNMAAHINELTMLSNSLQEEVRLLRLVPTSTLLQNLPRTVRDLGYKLKKQVTLEIKDRDTKIDKIVLEGIKDPIIHILRNAIDHGLEDADYRKAHGKPEVGHISIDVLEEGNNVLFLIKDDGGGIDPEKVANTALKNGAITKAELASMTQDEILNLIFRPGFSTKEVVTDVSGRGVGLDVVSANLGLLKGDVNVYTETGKGTTFVLRVPLTLATERGLIVESAGQLFALSTSFIERVLLLNKQDIVEVEKSQAILLDNQTVSLCSLANIIELGVESYISQNQLPIVVIKKGKNIAALLVDSIIQEREIVIKSLQYPFLNVPCVAGATLSGSGEIIIVLDLSDVMERAITLKHPRIVSKGFEDAVKASDTKHKLLVVDDSVTTRTFVRNMLHNKGYDVRVASDGQEAWDLLQQNQYDLMITDIEMPKMDGFELTQTVRGNAKYNDMKIIMVTSLDSEENKRRGSEAGADAYMVKSQFDSGALVELVDEMVSEL